jgi:Zn-dependent M16 (insulinase) family peptidase
MIVALGTFLINVELYLLFIQCICSTSSMSIGLQGVKDTDVEKVRSTIKSVLEQVKQEGFDPKRIEAAIHQMELGQKHVSVPS